MEKPPRKLLLSCMRSFYKIIQNTATQRTNSRYVSNNTTKVATSQTAPRLSHSPLPPASPSQVLGEDLPGVISVFCQLLSGFSKDMVSSGLLMHVLKKAHW